MHVLRFFLSALFTNIKLATSLKISFLFTLLIIIVKQALFLVAWSFFFNKYQLIRGWHFDELLLMYGIVSVAIGTVEIFFYGLRELPRLIEEQKLDVFLLQPKNIVLNIALSKGDITAIGEAILGVLLIFYSGYLFAYKGFIILILLSCILFIFSLYLYLSCFAFFMKRSTHLIREFYQNANIVATQPNVAYQGLFRIFTLTLLPTAFLSFFPVEFLRTGTTHYLLYAFLGSCSFFVLACCLFKLGLKRYESGNGLHVRY